MNTRKLLIAVLLLAIALSACTPAATPAPVPTSPSTKAVAGESTMMAASEPTKAPATEAFASQPDPNKPNDQTEARLRISNCVFNGPSLDVWINGKSGMNGGVSMPKLPPLGFSGYLYLQPGKYQVAVAPDGTGLDKPFAGPLDIPAIAGHRYTAVVMGQADEASHNLLLIDETAAYQALGVTPTKSRLNIAVNNLKGAPEITRSMGGVVRENKVPFGSYQAAVWPVGDFTGFEISASSTTQAIDSSSDPSWHSRGTDTMDCFGGKFPGAGGTDYDYLGSEINSDFTPADYMSFSTAAKEHLSFDTFMKVIQTAGLTDQLNKGGPYLIFAPSDDAFEVASLPKATLDAIQNDPKAAADFVKNYIVQGFFPVGSLIGGTSGSGRTVKNLLGKDLKIEGESVVNDDKYTLQINGNDEGSGLGAMTANGTRVQVINSLLPTSK